MKIASVPEWVVETCSGNCVRLYALLDLREGQLAVVTGSEITGLSRGTVQRALRELRDSGAIRRVANARYELRRDPPVSNHVRERPGLSTLSTELSTGQSTGESGDEAAQDERSHALSPVSTGPMTTAKDLVRGEEESGASTSVGTTLKEAVPTGGSVPKTLLVAVDGFERKQNLGFNALAEECNADPRTRSGEITAALNGSSKTGIGIRACVWQEATEAYETNMLSGPELVLAVRGGEAFEQLVVTAIKHRAKLYRNRMKGATLTPTALAKWWFDVEKLPEQGLTPDEIASGSWRTS